MYLVGIALYVLCPGQIPLSQQCDRRFGATKPLQFWLFFIQEVTVIHWAVLHHSSKEKNAHNNHTISDKDFKNQITSTDVILPALRNFTPVQLSVSALLPRNQSQITLLIHTRKKEKMKEQKNEPTKDYYQ